MTKSVTAPLVAVGTAAIKFSSDSQDAFQQFAAATGAASNEMGKYKDMINDVYKDNFGESINDALHSTMFLLIRIKKQMKSQVLHFTFHDVSINTGGRTWKAGFDSNFTFHDVSINTVRCR